MNYLMSTLKWATAAQVDTFVKEEEAPASVVQSARVVACRQHDRHKNTCTIMIMLRGEKSFEARHDRDKNLEHHDMG